MIVAVGVAASVGLGLFQMKRSMERAAEKTASSSAASASPSVPGTGRDVLQPVPDELVADAGKAMVGRIDLVLRVDGVQASLEGAPACRHTVRAHESTVGVARGGGQGTFDESALDACLASMRMLMRNRPAFVAVRRAGPAIVDAQLDALAAAVRRARWENVRVSY